MVLTKHIRPTMNLLALIEYVTNYFKEQIDSLSFPLQPVRPAFAIA